MRPLLRNTLAGAGGASSHSTLPPSSISIPRKCIVCRKTLRGNTNPVTCGTCTNFAHRSFTDVSCYSTDVGWTCPTCNLQQSQIPPPVPCPPQNSYCPECKGRLTSSRSNMLLMRLRFPLKMRLEDTHSPRPPA